MKVELPMFFKNETFEVNELIGKDTPFKDSDIKEMTFYNISCISKYVDDADGKEYACIHSNGSEFICSLGYNEVKKLIDSSI